MTNRIKGTFGIGICPDALAHKSVADLATEHIAQQARGLNYTISNIAWVDTDGGQPVFDIEIEFDRIQIQLAQDVCTEYVPSLLASLPELHEKLAEEMSVSVETIQRWARTDTAEYSRWDRASWEVRSKLRDLMISHLENQKLQFLNSTNEHYDEQQNKNGYRLFVGNIPWNVYGNEEKIRELENLFKQFGEAKLTLEYGKGKRPRGFGFVEMSEENADKAVNELDGYTFEGCSLAICE